MEIPIQEVQAEKGSYHYILQVSHQAMRMVNARRSLTCAYDMGGPGIFMSPYCFISLSGPSFSSFSRPLVRKPSRGPQAAFWLLALQQAWLAIPAWRLLSHKPEAHSSHVRAGHSVCTACVYLSKCFSSLSLWFTVLPCG